MEQCGGWYLPAGETHLVGWLTKQNQTVNGRLAYQYKKIARALENCDQFRTAVDVGCHIGLWSYYLAARFDRVHAFEPVEAHRQCFNLNVTSENVTLHPCALGEKDGSIRIESAPTSSGDSRVGGDGDIPLKRLDDFNLTNVDFIKLDNEGYELFALRGAEQTIRTFMPTIICEQKPGRAQRFGLPETGAVTYLEGLGYKCVAEMSGDYILVPQ